MIIFIVFTIHIGMQIKKVDSILLIFYNQSSNDDLEKLLNLLNRHTGLRLLDLAHLFSLLKVLFKRGIHGLRVF